MAISGCPTKAATGIALSIFAAGIFTGCLKPLQPDPAALNADSASPQPAPDCASCHAYPLHDVNHAYHLRALNPREAVATKFIYERKNGIIVCMDCHFGSLAHKRYAWYDTLWGTAGDVRTTPDKLPSDPIYRIDSTPGYLPLPAVVGAAATSEQVNAMLEQAFEIGKVVPWLTGSKHMNGKVDVEFSSSLVPDSAQRLQAYHPQDISCSSVECHNAPKKKYRWASMNKALSGCPTAEHSPQLDSSCGYLPSQEPK